MLVWTLPETLKVAKGPAFSTEDCERLYTVQDIFDQMRGDEVTVIGQLKHMVMIGPENNVNSAEYSIDHEDALQSNQKALS